MSPSYRSLYVAYRFARTIARAQPRTSTVCLKAFFNRVAKPTFKTSSTINPKIAAAAGPSWGAHGYHTRRRPTNSERKHEEGQEEMGLSIETPSTRRRNGEKDGQDRPSDHTIGVDVWIRDMGTFRANERHAGRLPQSMRETNDEAVHTTRPRARRRMDYTPGR
jgi:hypothetical protein